VYGDSGENKMLICDVVTVTKLMRMLESLVIRVNRQVGMVMYSVMVGQLYVCTTHRVCKL